MATNKWGFWLLTAFVVGNMVGSGIFMLPSSLANTASPLGVTLAWLLTGLGVLMIALVFGNLSIRRPELTAGPQSYARDMFTSRKAGNMAGFSMAWGYWVANWSGNVAIITTFAGYLSTFFPIMKDERILFMVGSFPVEIGKLTTFFVCSILLWGINGILLRGLNGAGKLNFFATATKVIGFGLFIVASLYAFNAANLGEFYLPVTDEEGVVHGLGSQINLAAISTLWAFVGIESAVVFSGRARSQRDVKRATIAGLGIAVAIYIGITLLTMGVLPQEVLKASDKPLVDALTAVIGSVGGTLMALLAVASLLGTSVGWILLSAEIPYQAAQSGIFPRLFAKTNQNGSPSTSLVLTNVFSQLFIFSTISGTIAEAFAFVTVVATLAYLIPYLVSAIYQLKLVITGQAYKNETGSRVKDGIIAFLAVSYSAWVIKSGTADLKTFGLGIGLFLLGFILYPFMSGSKKKAEQHGKVVIDFE